MLVSTFQEDFMDLCVTVAGFESLEQALGESYVVMETMDGNNQYKCEKCQKLVDAKKVSSETGGCLVVISSAWKCMLLTFDMRCTIKSLI